MYKYMRVKDNLYSQFSLEFNSIVIKDEQPHKVVAKLLQRRNFLMQLFHSCTNQLASYFVILELIATPN